MSLDYANLREIVRVTPLGFPVKPLTQPEHAKHAIYIIDSLSITNLINNEQQIYISYNIAFYY